MWLALWLGLGCGARTNEVAPTAPTEASAAPVAAAAEGDARERMIRLLSTRDAGPTCAELEALSSDPVGDLTAIVQTVAMPPMVPMRAADCLVSGHAQAAEATLAAWVADPNTKGLAMLVTDRIDGIPRDTALRLAERAMAGPHAAAVRPALAESKTPGIPEISGATK